MKTMIMQCHEMECPVQWEPRAVASAGPAGPAGAVGEPAAELIRVAALPRPEIPESLRERFGHALRLALYLVQPEDSVRTGRSVPRWLGVAKIALCWAAALGIALALGQVH